MGESRYVNFTARMATQMMDLARVNLRRIPVVEVTHPVVKNPRASVTLQMVVI